LDKEIADWIDSNPHATPADFEQYLRQLYNTRPTYGSFSSRALRVHFYVLTKAIWSDHDTQYAEGEPNIRGDAPRCPKCDLFVGMLTWLPPYVAEITLFGSAPGDIAYNSVADLLVSRRFTEAYAQSQLAGLKGFEPVQIAHVHSKNAHSTALPEYFHVEVARGGAAVDDTRSHIVRSGPVTCPVCRLDGVEAIRGFTLEEDSWTGEDIFIPRGLPGIRIAGERFRAFVEMHNISNVLLTPTTDYVWDPLHKG